MKRRHRRQQRQKRVRPMHNLKAGRTGSKRHKQRKGMLHEQRKK